MKPESLRKLVKDKIEEVLEHEHPTLAPDQRRQRVDPELAKLEGTLPYSQVWNAFIAFKRSRNQTDFGTLKALLENWMKGNAIRDHWIKVENYSDPIQALWIWSQNYQRKEVVQNSEAFDRVRPAAQVVLDIYGKYMPDDYRQAVQTTFLDKTKSDHFHCVRYYAQDFSSHIDKVAPELKEKYSPRDIKGYTPTRDDASEEDSKNVANIVPPYNRRIEFFNETNPHTMVHEVLHWVCHEQFRIDSDGGRSDYVREGFTESLARRALNEPAVGGYEDYFPYALDAINSNKPAWSNVFAAYFKGENIQNAATQFRHSSPNERLHHELRKRNKGCAGCTVM